MVAGIPGFRRPNIVLERPIIKPSAPSWVAPFGSGNPQGDKLTLMVALVLAVIVVAPFVLAPHLVLAGVLIPILIVLMLLLIRFASTVVVSATDPKIGGTPITGHGLELLADTLSRFDYARREVGKIPTGIKWSEIDEHVRVLLWDAAEHAGRMSALDAELHELRYAVAGTPQAAYRGELADRRAEHEQVLLGAQRDAEDLARKAGNAAAAAHLALVRTGDLARLEVVAPSGPALRARDALAGAKQRLDMLAAVWAELDPGGPVAVEKIRADSEAQSRTRRTRRR